ncbi:MAG TPA: hypothetical protein VE972_04035 [Conexibacter sp.]|nr:hypothetical protein [Conexibacter sp.]
MQRIKTAAVAALALACLASPGVAAAHPSDPHGGPPPPVCHLGGGIKHVIAIQFDNTHFNRDRPDVASDLEQMPHLLSFLRGQGTLFTNDHTILISHTAGGIVSTLTGLYPDRNGLTASNGYGYFRSDTGGVGFSPAFKYWTAPVDALHNPLPSLIGDGQKTTPAPWVPFTRAGCDTAGVSTANIELENVNTDPTGDMTTVFGTGSPEWNEASNPATRTQAAGDFLGLAVHCAAGSGLCASNPNARPDLLPDEPGGYDGFKALFGAKYVNPAITHGNACVADTAGNPMLGPAGTCGFAGFGHEGAKETLGYIAQLQEAGVPVTFSYIGDAHDDRTTIRASGPGEAGYVAQLKDYDAAFAAFFTRLAHDGIDRSNTLFVVTVDEGDHFAGGPGMSQADGSLAYAHTACVDLTSCPSNQMGEVSTDIQGLLPAGESPFALRSDSAPGFYVGGQPVRTDAGVRKLERDVAALRVVDPYLDGRASVPLAQRLADTVEERTLHMINGDPSRTPTFTMFANPDFFVSFGGTGCGTSTCVAANSAAWNHGDFQDEIATTWVGMVGPGVERNGIDARTWTDHTNVRPTMLALLGLHDDYRHDGRVLVEGLRESALPQALRVHGPTVRRLGDAYEQLNAPFGAFAQDTLAASTRALASTNDGEYAAIENAIASLTSERDALAGKIKAQLNGAAFDGHPVGELQALIEMVHAELLIHKAAVLPH